MQLEKSKPIQLNQLQEALDGILQQKPCSFQSLSADQSIEVKTDIPEIPKQATYPVVGDPHWYSLNDSPHPTTVFTDSSPFAYSHLRNVNCKAGDKSTIEVFQSFQNNALIGGLRGSADEVEAAVLFQSAQEDFIRQLENERAKEMKTIISKNYNTGTSTTNFENII